MYSKLFIFITILVQILEGISDIRDESDRSGMRIVIEVCLCHSNCNIKIGL